MDKSHFKRHRRAYLFVGGALCLIALSIWSNTIVSTVGKVILTILFAAIVLALVAIAYRDMVKSYEETPSSPVTTNQLATIPPKPTRPPFSAKEPETSRPLYDHRPRPIPAIGYSLLASGSLAGLFLVGAYTQLEAIWAVTTLYGIVAVIWCYWQWVKWRGRYLIITDERMELQCVLPWPFVTHAPTMPNKIGATQDIKRTFVDRLFGTCRLFSDIKAKGDEVFHNLKWLPYPDELRRALGQNPIRRNSWWPIQKKKS